MVIASGFCVLAGEIGAQTALSHLNTSGGVNVDAFTYGMDPACLLLFFGDLKAMRTGVTKVLDAHMRMLARVRQGTVTADGCVHNAAARYAARARAANQRH